MVRSVPGLGGSFSFDDGRRAGLTAHELRDERWSRPFVGTRAYVEPETPEELAHAYAAKMRDEAYYSHVTAAILWDMWLPPELKRRMQLHVSVPPGARAPRDRLVKGHHLIERPGFVVTRKGLRVAQPWEVWCQLATILGMVDLIVAGESLLAKNRRDRLSLETLVRAVAVGGRPRQRMLERALPRLREGSRSAKETELRLMIVADGMPEPEVNGDVHDASGVWIGEFDLIYRVQRLIVEYDGEGHFLNTKERRKDVRRDRLLAAAGWKVIRVMKDDLAENPREVLDLIRRELAARS